MRRWARAATGRRRTARARTACRCRGRGGTRARGSRRPPSRRRWGASGTGWPDDCRRLQVVCRTREWHYSRNQLNRPAASLEAALAERDPEPAERSIFHRIGRGNENNIKILSTDGRHESVFRPTGEAVTSAENMGTYNRGVDDFSHAIRDVLPYLVFGNTPDDKTTVVSRTMIMITGGSTARPETAVQREARRLEGESVANRRY
jgi:hypothetical protein